MIGTSRDAPPSWIVADSSVSPVDTTWCGTADIVGQRQDGWAIQRAQLGPRAFLEQAFEALAASLVATLAAVRAVLEVPQREELAERRFRGRVVAMLNEQLVERAQPAASPAGAAVRIAGLGLRPPASCRAVAGGCRDGRRRRGPGAARQQRPCAEPDQRHGGGDRADTWPSAAMVPGSVGRRPRTAACRTYAALTRCSSRVKAPSSARSQTTLITRGMPPLSR